MRASSLVLCALLAGCGVPSPSPLVDVTSCEGLSAYGALPEPIVRPLVPTGWDFVPYGRIMPHDHVTIRVVYVRCALAQMLAVATPIHDGSRMPELYWLEGFVDDDAMLRSFGAAGAPVQMAGFTLSNGSALVESSDGRGLLLEWSRIGVERDGSSESSTASWGRRGEWTSIVNETSETRELLRFNASFHPPSALAAGSFVPFSPATWWTGLDVEYSAPERQGSRG